MMLRRGPRYLRSAARRAAAVLVLFALVFAVLRAGAQMLVCSFTNEVTSSCCCAGEREKPPPTPEIARRCCCRTVTLASLPNAGAVESRTVTIPPASAVALAALPVDLTAAAPLPRLLLAPRETGPPRAMPRRLALLQILRR